MRLIFTRARRYWPEFIFYILLAALLLALIRV